MDDEQAGYMGAVRWVNFNHHGEPESGDARTMDDGSVWAHIAGPDPRVTTTGGCLCWIRPASRRLV